jgi:hypothetical protein
MAIDSTLRGIRLQIDQATDPGEQPEVKFGLANAAGQSWTLARFAATEQGSFGGRLAIEVNAGGDSPTDTTAERLSIDSAGDVGIAGGLTVGGTLKAGAVGDVAAEITTLKGRTFTAADVGALPISGGTLTGGLTVQGTLQAGAIADVAAEITTLKGRTFTAADVGALAIGGGTLGGNLTVNGIVDAVDIRINGAPLASSPWVTVAGGINYSGGNVGIGAATPAGKLEVQGPWGDWIFLRQKRDKDGGGGFHFHNPWGNSNQPQGSPDRNRLEIAYAKPGGGTLWGQLVIQGPTGNVGIGTVAPGAKLHVYRSDTAGYEDNAMKIQTQHGYMTFGSLNNAWFHMHTDRPSFYFNKPAHAKGGFHTYSTRDHKKDIHYLSVEEEDRVLSSIAGLRMATFRYRDGELGDKIHTGIIAEEAPEAVLSQGGRSIDLYDYVSYGMTAVKALQRRLERMEALMREFEPSGGVVGPQAKEV